MSSLKIQYARRFLLGCGAALFASNLLIYLVVPNLKFRGVVQLAEMALGAGMVFAGLLIRKSPEANG